MNQTLYFVISGPSGVGKTTIIRKLLETVEDLGNPISHTSRAAREGEIEGVHYFFRSSEIMTQMRVFGEFAECTTRDVGPNYGLSKAEIRRMRAYKSAVLDLDTEGAKAIKELLGDAVVLIMVAPQYGYQLEDRLKHRATENDREIRKRLDRAAIELSVSGEYDYLVVNRSTEESVAQLKAIIQTEHLSLKRRHNLLQVKAVMDDLCGVI